jgi:hypothetical protein
MAAALSAASALSDAKLRVRSAFITFETRDGSRLVDAK